MDIGCVTIVILARIKTNVKQKQKGIEIENENI